MPIRHILLRGALAVLVLLIGAGCAKRPPVQTQDADPALSDGPQVAGTQDTIPGREPLRPPSGLAEQELLARERQAALEAAQRRRESQMRLTPAAFTNQDIHFSYDSYLLSEEAKTALEEKAAWLLQNAQAMVQVEGHCDERGTSAYNLALGERRAAATKQYLTYLGISSARLATISYGEEQPLDPSHNDTAWARNRRAHFEFLP